MEYIQEMLQIVKKKYGDDFSLKEIEFSGLVFEERVLFNCFYCGKYGMNWRCPPNLPNLNYKKILEEYDHLAFLWIRMPYDEDNYDEVRAESSTRVHKALLHLEKYLWNNNNSTSISFIGGSCKLCRNGCGKDRCNNPYMSRSPLEATGLNVIETAKNFGIDILFPPDGFMTRLGLIAW